MGAKAYWYDFAHQRSSGQTTGQATGRPQDVLVKDARWPALRARLNAAGAPWNATFDDLDDMQVGS